MLFTTNTSLRRPPVKLRSEVVGFKGWVCWCKLLQFSNQQVCIKKQKGLKTAKWVTATPSLILKAF